MKDFPSSALSKTQDLLSSLFSVSLPSLVCDAPHGLFCKATKKMMNGHVWEEKLGQKL